MALCPLDSLTSSYPVMPPLEGLARRCIQAAALVIFAYQMIQAGTKYFSSGSTPSVQTMDIGDANLPDIYVCLKISKKMQPEGTEYATLEAFIRGNQAKYKNVRNGPKIVSWEGENDLPYENMTRQLYPKMNQFNITQSNNWTSNQQIVFTSNDGFCYKIKINATNIPPSDLFYLTFDGLNAANADLIKIIIADTGRNPYYMLNTDSLNGDEIEPEKYFWKTFSINFEETHWLEESGECTNYGEGAEFKTFADCLANEHEKIFKPILGCNVPWLSAPSNPDICQGSIHLTPDASSLFGDNLNERIRRIDIAGTTSQSHGCLKPCVKLQAYSTRKQRRHDLNGSNGTKNTKLQIIFEKKVRVTKYQRTYGLFELVVDVGSSLGLWIGLSVLGLFDLLLQSGTALKKRMRRPK